MRALMKMFPIFFMIMPLLGSAESLDQLDGNYYIRKNCLRDSLENVCNLYEIDATLSIKKISHTRAWVGIEVKQMLRSNFDLQPYYCSLEGISDASNNDLEFVNDSDGTPIDGLKIKITSEYLTVLSSLEINQRYCGAHVYMDGLSFSRKGKQE